MHAPQPHHRRNSKRRKQPLSPEERERRRQQRLQSVERLLYSREQTAAALGNVSVRTVIRMEERGALTAIRLPGSGPLGKVFHNSEQVRALAQGRLSLG
jgi:hypothetical protein